MPPLSPEQRALNPDQRELVAQTCDQVMGLKGGGIYRSACMDSLARSLAAKVESARLAVSSGHCHSQGLAEGSAAFSTCMLDRQDAAAAASPASWKPRYDATAPQNAGSYFDVSNSEHWRRERYSCAQIGLMPGTAPFSQCVGGLTGALMPNPF